MSKLGKIGTRWRNGKQVYIGIRAKFMGKKEKAIKFAPQAKFGRKEHLTHIRSAYANLAASILIVKIPITLRVLKRKNK